ncbi:hypothetical protein V8G54_031993 [Vigna mungo]|uniref:Isopenicillin N synthase-like Fe(2+) 2OG dioxygenase domain-containing protein n=1 Tax=Vigna mungo TaxID=3915 RepID=A0AAQ3RIE8_VIGMU
MNPIDTFFNNWVTGPQPQLVHGLTGHTDPNTDPNALEILLQELHVAGLQVHGNWLAVNSHPNAFVIKGYQFQSLRNELYKSVWQRAVVNADKPMLSVASFLCPNDEALDNPAKHGSEAIYRGYTYAEYYRKFWSRNLDKNSFGTFQEQVTNVLNEKKGLREGGDT